MVEPTRCASGSLDREADDLSRRHHGPGIDAPARIVGHRGTRHRVTDLIQLEQRPGNGAECPLVPTSEDALQRSRSPVIHAGSVSVSGTPRSAAWLRHGRARLRRALIRTVSDLPQRPGLGIQSAHAVTRGRDQLRRKVIGADRLRRPARRKAPARCRRALDREHRIGLCEDIRPPRRDDRRALGREAHAISHHRLAVAADIRHGGPAIPSGPISSRGRRSKLPRS